jgi:hypothetical protein
MCENTEQNQSNGLELLVQNGEDLGLVIYLMVDGVCWCWLDLGLVDCDGVVLDGAVLETMGGG